MLEHVVDFFGRGSNQDEVVNKDEVGQVMGVHWETGVSHCHSC